MIAIQTRIYGPTNHRPARIKAWTSNGQTLWVSRDDAAMIAGARECETYYDRIHRGAAKLLALKYGWDIGKLVGGGVKGGMVWVFKY